jgi:antitoxin HigA-1
MAIARGRIAFALTTSGVSASYGERATLTKSRSWTITRSMQDEEAPMVEREKAKREKLLPPIHPGEILRVDFMEPLGLSMNRLALDLRVPVTRIAEIVHERRGITPDTALRLARYFNTTPGFWLNLQSSYDLEVAQDKLSRTIEREVRPSTFAVANAAS